MVTFLLFFVQERDSSESFGSEVVELSHLRKELLGSATIDLLDTLRTHDGKSKSSFIFSHGGQLRDSTQLLKRVQTFTDAPEEHTMH